MEVEHNRCNTCGRRVGRINIHVVRAKGKRRIEDTLLHCPLCRHIGWCWIEGREGRGMRLLCGTNKRYRNGACHHGQSDQTQEEFQLERAFHVSSSLLRVNTTQLLYQIRRDSILSSFI